VAPHLYLITTSNGKPHLHSHRVGLAFTQLRFTGTAGLVHCMCCCIKCVQCKAPPVHLLAVSELTQLPARPVGVAEAWDATNQTFVVLTTAAHQAWPWRALTDR